jgi:hypothetical protein
VFINAINVISLITIKININTVNIMMAANSAKKLRILRKRKISYTAQTVTGTVLIKTVLIITVKLAGKFINVKTVMRFY